MARIQINFPDDLEKEILKKAENEGATFENFVIETLKKQLLRKDYPSSFWKTLNTTSEVELDLDPSSTPDKDA
jgi:hypothetical protein